MTYTAGHILTVGGSEVPISYLVFSDSSQRGKRISLQLGEVGSLGFSA